MLYLTRCLSLAGLILCIPCFLLGQLTPIINPGRPTNTSGPYTVDPGMWHVETGFSIESTGRLNQPLRFYNLAVPGIDIRTGILKDVEINLGVVEKIDFLGKGTGSGIGPVNLGLKFNVYHSENALPNVSFIAKVALPVGSEDLRPEQVSPSMKVIFAHTVSPKSTIMYNLGAFWQEQPFVRGNYALMYGYSINKVLSTYAELYGGFTQIKDLKGNLAGGLMYSPQPQVMIDISGGVDLQKNLESYYFALGASFRFFTGKEEN